MDERREVKPCHYCGKEVPSCYNYCDWNCIVAEAKANGGKVHCPNGLPIGSIDRDGNMWEHEHGDHPDYKFPVTVEFIGKRPKLPEWDHSYTTEVHALLYTDGYIALTIYECTYALWSLKDGLIRAGQMWKKGDWRLSDDAIMQITQLSELQRKTT